MFKRLLTFMRKGGSPDPKRVQGNVAPLCRLRHATLHPGATLWTPGVGGGNLGGGAASALDEAGLGGEVVVGFQSGAREPVHVNGVVARIEERVAFPESWNPEGLGANHRYRLLGVRRVVIDPLSTTNKRIPTVNVSATDPRPEDTAPPPPELVEILTALSGLENNWPEHWREAFVSLPNAQLGQWATTLGWRLSRDERLMLFDQPHKVAEVLLSTLDGLHLGLAPERRREAVRVQTLTRRTSLMPERSIEVIADEDGWAIFHPADVHPASHTTGPVTLPAAAGDNQSRLQNHFVAGNVINVRAHVGRCCRVRLTALSLTPEEESRRLGESTFRLLVRHGRLFLGGATLLRAGSYQDRLEFADASQWFDVPNGVFRATVIALAAAPIATASDPNPQLTTIDGPSDDSPEPDLPTSPEYVVQLRASESLDDIAAPSVPPTI